MGLDKWIKPEDADKNPKKKRITSEQVKESINDQKKKNTVDIKSPKLVKYSLVCQNKKCKFQKIMMKKLLTEEDKTCPRCKKEMKLKEV